MRRANRPGGPVYPPSSSLPALAPPWFPPRLLFPHLYQPRGWSTQLSGPSGHDLRHAELNSTQVREIRGGVWLWIQKSFLMNSSGSLTDQAPTWVFQNDQKGILEIPSPIPLTVSTFDLARSSVSRDFLSDCGPPPGHPLRSEPERV